ncbi:MULTISPECIES: transketolase [Cycloclasticus]|uniref:Transketolase n=1 Tax=Cycloclasticus pugetii TaxID=34068 RepID=A0AB33YZ63_9GAMM|nr:MULTISPECIES: transketolase [Cycloclasticus]ATI02382.1 transketolase [Cycloclasticus sp. PY97N]EPD12471.1 transketolase [Cycloclasticus pugetii]
MSPRPSRQTLANAIRVLSMDAVQQANSGHPGAPMGMADIAEVLWNDFLSHNPANPHWVNRDRFVLSNGHGSMLLYSLLHLSGYDLDIEDIRNFRQLHSKTPGHPEYGYAPGVETTTGPLGQGISNAVGMALAEKVLAAQFNQPNFKVVDHYTYTFMGDGCLMEGISHEACSYAGTLGLGKLIAFWDDNGISIDGDVEGWFTDDTPARFEAYGWQVVRDVDGHNANDIKQAIEQAQKETNKPTLICCKTVIGSGAPNKEGTHHVHGAPLGAEEIAATRKALGWAAPAFEIPAEVKNAWDANDKGEQAEAQWEELLEAYVAEYPDLADELLRRLSGELSADWAEKSEAFVQAAQQAGETIASRKASLNTLNGYGPLLPELLGGSADLTGSNLTKWSGCTDVDGTNANGNYLHYGVREFGMSAIQNGIALHGGFIPYGATFLTFSDYARNAVRMAALMKLRNIFVFTHDSIGLGEDGPTHQSVEHVSSLRLIPNLDVWRPCDAVESAVAWKYAVENESTPSALIFTRQNVQHQPRTADQVAAISKGGYILKDCEGEPQVILMATGSEVELATTAADVLAAEGVKVRVLSMPCTDLFDRQDMAYKESILPASVTARVAIEAGSTSLWYKYVGLQGAVIGLDRFGESAPAKELFEYFGITAEKLVEAAKNLI